MRYRVIGISRRNVTAPAVNHKRPRVRMDRIPLNDLQRSYACRAAVLEAAVIDVMRTGWWLNGPRNRAFCKAFAAYVGVKHCVGVANGTDALEISLRAVLSLDARFHGFFAGWSEERPEIITVANAGGYTAASCHIVGCTPVYIDIESSSQLVAIPAIARALSKKTAAVVVTHLYGGLVDVPSIRRLLDDYGYPNIPIIEDCAQAHGASGAIGRAGALGDVATFSFYPTKNLGALGDGGAVVTNNDAVAEQVRRLHQYGWSEKYRVGVHGGRNSRLDEVQAMFLQAQLQHLDAANERRRAILEVYCAAAAKTITFATSRHGTVAHLAVLLTESRDDLRAHLEMRGISTDIHYPVLDCDQQGWRRLPHRISQDLDVSHASVAKLLTVPCFPTMTDEEVERVAGALAEYRA